jgi:23S rRNA U2552 (ribose-2'-O)-methylase RlmE/FtsJ
MAKYYNYEDYLTYIKDKYNKSNMYYKKKFLSKEPVEVFLMTYEAMNVFPIYPRPIIMPLKREINYSDKLERINDVTFKSESMDKITDELKNKIKELEAFGKTTVDKRGTEKVRRFFDYEIKDALRDMLKNSKITVAWIKMYEILTAYNFLDNIKEETINTFHLCEHPGAFVFATKEYINRKSKRKHNFVFQSLRPGKDPQIFRADPELLNKYRKNLDYGNKGTGDITDPDNIKYYRNKYKNEYYHLITSDCGLDFSEDFNKQEIGLYKIYLGALICALGLSKKGSNYIYKLFSFGEKKTVELLYITCIFYENVDLVRLMTDKSGSGEIYAICSNFNYSGNFDAIFDRLLDYLKDNKGFIVDFSNEKFKKIIEQYHLLLTMRRITNYNMLMFRQLNHPFATDHEQARTFVKHLTEYYTKYFITFVGLDNEVDITRLED